MSRKLRAFKFQPFSRQQLKILTWWLDNSPVKDSDGIIADGAIRSGKTVSMALSFVMWAMTKFNGENFAMCGKTIGSFRRNVWNVLKTMLPGRGYQYTEHRSDNYIEIRKGNVSNLFYVFGGRDESSQDLIQGLTLAGLFCDEVALMPESFVNQATGRCSVDGSKMWFNCNPDGPMHWFNQNWILKAKEKNLIYLHFTMDDNLSLSEHIKQRYRSMYVGVFYKRYIQGLWSIAEGAIFDMWVENINEIRFEDLPKDIQSLRRYISIDYGTTNATVFLDCYYDTSKNIVWIPREYYYDSKTEMKQKTDKQYADDLVKFVSEGKSPTAIIIDPSAASFKAEVKSRGLRVKEADNDVLDGIRMTSTMISQGNIRMVKNKCKRSIGDILSYVWDEKAAQHGIEKPVKENDHGADALRYFVKTVVNPRRLGRTA